MGFVKGEEKEFEPFHECEEQEKLNSDDKCDPKRVRQQEIDQQNSPEKATAEVLP